MFEKVINFFKEVRLETKKVNWPTRKETIRYTLVTIAITIIIAAYLGGLDFVFTDLLNRFIIK